MTPESRHAENRDNGGQHGAPGARALAEHTIMHPRRSPGRRRSRNVPITTHHPSLVRPQANQCQRGTVCAALTHAVQGTLPIRAWLCVQQKTPIRCKPHPQCCLGPRGIYTPLCTIPHPDRLQSPPPSASTGSRFLSSLLPFVIRRILRFGFARSSAVSP